MVNRNLDLNGDLMFDFDLEKIDTLRACIEFVESSKKGYSEADFPYVMGPQEKTFKISPDQIFKLPKCEDQRTIGFVDGGYAPILKSADFSVCFHRVAGVKYQASQHIPMTEMPEIIEYYTATILNLEDDGTLTYITKYFPREANHSKFLPDKPLTVKSTDEEIMKRRYLPKIESFGNAATRFSEWAYAKELINRELDEGDIFVRDGSLQTSFKDEILFTRRLYKKATSKNVYVTGLSKSCRLITKTGDSLQLVINLIANDKYPDDNWYYHPIYKITKSDNQADLYFVRLNRNSSYPFRFDIYIHQSEKLTQSERENLISNLALNSQDLSFPGYPYGLIKVDQLSRVAYREIESHKVMLLSEFNKDHYEKFILPRIRTVDAHDLLNKIRKN